MYTDRAGMLQCSIVFVLMGWSLLPNALQNVALDYKIAIQPSFEKDSLSSQTTKEYLKMYEQNVTDTIFS